MISKAGEIYQALVAEFPDALQSITELSKNDAGDKNFIVSDAIAFKFDQMQNFATNKSEQKERSPDALFLHDDTLYFVEFKEGEVDKTNIRQKIHEAIINLFHYACSRKIATRAQFLDLSIRYAVVMRFKLKNGTCPPSFFDSLELSKDFFHLKNLEGLIIQKTTVVFNTKTIFALLNKISDGKITRIELMSSDQSSKEICPPPD